MRKLLSFLIVVMFFSFCKQTNQTNTAKDENSSKDSVVVIEIAEIEGNLDSLENKVVKVSGYVFHVCHEDGKKLFLKDTVNNAIVKVFTEQAFDTTLEGSTVTLKGVLMTKVFTIDDYRKLENKMKEKHPNGLHQEDKERLENLWQKLQNPDSSFKNYYIQFEEFCEK